MKKIKQTRLLKKLGMLASTIAPIAVVATGEGSGSSDSPGEVNLITEAAKFSDFTSTRAINAVPSNMKTASNDDIKTEFEAIPSYRAPILGTGISIKKVVVKGISGNVVTYTITLAKTGQSDEDKDVAVTYGEATVAVAATKFSDFTSTRAINAVPSNMKTASNDDIKTEFEAIPSYRAPILGTGISIKKVVVKGISGNVVTYTITLAKTGQSDEDKDVAVTYGEATVAVAATKFSDFTSTRAINAVPSNMKTASNDDIKTEFEAIPSYRAPILGTGISIKKVVVKGISGNVVTYTIALAKTGQSDEDKDVAVTYGEATVAVAATKFSDFTSTRAINAVPSNMKTASNDDIKTEFETIPSYRAPILGTGISIKKVVVKGISGNVVTYTITLAKTGQSDEDKDVAVTYGEATVAVAATKFSDFTSTRAINAVPSNMKTASNDDIKTEFEAIPSYRAPILGTGISIKKVVVKGISGNVVTYTITLAKTGQSDEDKDVAVTYGEATVAVAATKFSDFTSTRAINAVPSNMKTASNDDIKTEFEAIPSYRAPILGTGISIKKVVVKGISGNVVTYTITLAKTGQSDEDKDVAVTYGEATVAVAATKFSDFTSTRAINAVPSNMKTASNDDIKTEFEAIPSYRAPILGTGISIKKVVVKGISGNVVTYTITLAKTGQSDEDKDVAVTYGEATVAVAATKFSDFTSTRAINAVPSNMKTASNDDIKTEFETIPSYRAPILGTGISIKKVVVKGISGNVVTYTITLAKTGQSDEDKDVAVTYGEATLSAAANKFVDFSSTLNAKDLKENLKIKNDDSGANDVQVDFVKIPGYINHISEDGISISKVVVKTPFDENTRQVVYTLTVVNRDDSEDKDVTITFAPDWVAELEKIKDFVATDNITSAAAKLAQNNNDVKDAYNAISGYEVPQFASNVEIKKAIVKTVLDANSRKVVYTVTLWDGTHTHSTTKDVIVTFAPDWDTALAKFVDFETTDNVESATAILKADANVDVKDEFEGITKPSSYTKPTFSEGVAISKVVVKTALDENTRQVVYSITLKNGDEDHTTTKDVIVTFTHTLAAEANKIKDFVTSDDLAKAASFLKSTDNKKTEFEAIADYVQPTFFAGISITKVVVETEYDGTPPPNENNRQVVFKVTLEENNNNPKIDNPTIDKLVTVTFKPNFTLEKNKLTKKSDGSPKEFSFKKGTYSELAKKQKNEDVTKLFIENGGLILPKFAPGVSIKLVVVKMVVDSNRKANYSVTLTDTRTDEGPFDVVVQFAENLDAGLNDLNDFTTTDDTKSNAAMLAESMDDKKDEFTGITGFTTPTFAEGVSISQVIVKTKLNPENRQVVYEVTLQEDKKTPSTPNPTKKKDITVTFAPDLDVEGNKFSDFSTTDNDKSDAAVLDASDQDVQGTFKAITGYTAPNLIEGVTIKSISVKNAINDKRQVVFKIKLGFGDNEAEKDVTVTFAASPSQAKDTALTTSQIVGIGIGSALGVGVLGYLIYYLIKRRR